MNDASTRVKQIADEIGFDRCGIAAAGPIPRGDYFREWLARGHAGTMGYLHRHTDSRVDVRAWLPWARSVIVVALNYHQTPPERPADEPRGRVAMYAWGEDYHDVMRDRLDRMVDRLRASWASADGGADAPLTRQSAMSSDAAGLAASPVPRPTRDGEALSSGAAEPRFHVCVDTSAVIERELAAAAGVGWIGKNTLVMHEALGSYFFLGEIFTDRVLTPDPPAVDHCGSCRRCLDACPTQAFTAPYAMDASRCISYLTIEHRSAIDSAIASRMGDWVFGCDICQDVCPHNAHAPETREQRFRIGVDSGRTKRDSGSTECDSGTVDLNSDTDRYRAIDRDAECDASVSPVVDPACGTGVSPVMPSDVDAAYPRLADLLSRDAETQAAVTSRKATGRARPDMWRRNAAIAAGNSAQHTTNDHGK